MKTITTPQGKVVVDESPKNKNWFIPINNFYIDDCNCIRKSFTNDVEYWAVRKNYYEILVSINFSIHKDVPMVIVEYEVEIFVKEQMGLPSYVSIDSMAPSMLLSFNLGVVCYKAAQQKGVYSEADMRKIYMIAWNKGRANESTSMTQDIQSLNQEPIELEMEEFVEEETGDVYKWVNKRIKTTRSSDGQLMAYEKSK